MKYKRTLGIIVAAMLLGFQVNGTASAATVSPSDLSTIESYIANGQIAELLAFLLEHPELMEGDSAFAVALSDFFISAQNGGVFAFSDALLSAVQAALDEALASAEGGRSSLY